MNSFFERLEAQLHTAAEAQTAGSRARLRMRWGWLRTGRRIVPTLAVLAATVAVTVGVAVVAFTIGSHAHGVGRQSQGVGSTPTAATSTATTNAAATPSGPPDCNAAGINAQQLREGTCVINGTSIGVVVNKTGTLHLKSLDANYVGLRRNGKLATVTITIKNNLDKPQQWQHTMAALFIPRTSSGAGNGPDYVENLDAETGDQNSCLRRTGTAANGGLQPGASVTCDAVFEIPTSADPAAPGGTLDLANFGDDVSNASQPVGVIRTYH